MNIKIKVLLFWTLVSSILTSFSYLYFTRNEYFSEVLFIRGHWAILIGFFICSFFGTVFIFFISKNKLFISFIASLYSSIIPFLLISWFHSLILVSYERSITVYTISYLDRHFDNQLFNKIDFYNVIFEGYMKNTNVIQKRIDEQIRIGYIKKIDEDTYKLTPKAKRFLSNSRRIARLFNIKMDFLSPKKIYFR